MKEIYASEYNADSRFLLIDARIRSQNQLSGYSISKVTRQLVNGYLYEVTYTSNKGQSKKFKAYIDFGNIIDITNMGETTTPVVDSTSVSDLA